MSELEKVLAEISVKERELLALRARANALVGLSSDDAINDVLQTARSGNVIEAVKKYRAAFGTGLREAHGAVSALCSTNGIPFNWLR